MEKFHAFSVCDATAVEGDGGHDEDGLATGGDCLPTVKTEKATCLDAKS